MSHTISADARFQLVLLLHRFSRPFCLFLPWIVLIKSQCVSKSSVEMIKSHWKSVRNQFHRKCRSVQSIDIHGYARLTQLLPIQKPMARSRLTFQVAPGPFQLFFLFSLSVCLTLFIFSPLFYSPVFDLHRINVMMKNDCLKRVEFLVWLQFFVHLRRQRFHSLFA